MKSKETKKIEKVMGVAPDEPRKNVCLGCRYYRSPVLPVGTAADLELETGSWAVVAAPFCSAFNASLPVSEYVVECKYRKAAGRMRAAVKITRS